jgi:hypothetical protein
MLGNAKAQPLERSEVCAVLAVANSTPLGDNLPPELNAGGMQHAYNFETASYECGETSYPTQIGAARPAYFSIGFSDDDATAVVGVEIMPAEQSGIGRGYSCVFRQTAAAQWDAIGCRAILVIHHQGPPNPIPVP